MEENFSMDQEVGDGFGMIQAHYIYCTLISNLVLPLSCHCTSPQPEVGDP